jgi:hypothetical protein
MQAHTIQKKSQPLLRAQSEVVKAGVCTKRTYLFTSPAICAPTCRHWSRVGGWADWQEP